MPLAARTGSVPAAALGRSGRKPGPSFLQRDRGGGMGGREGRKTAVAALLRLGVVAQRQGVGAVGPADDERETALPRPRRGSGPKRKRKENQQSRQ